MGQAKRRKKEIEELKNNGTGRRTRTKLLPNKQVQIAEYIGSKLDGRSIVMNDDILIGDATFKDGELHGVSKVFSNNGLFREFSTFKNGQRKGLTISFDGVFFMVGTIVNDVIKDAKMLDDTPLQDTRSIKEKNEYVNEVFEELLKLELSK